MLWFSLSLFVSAHGLGIVRAASEGQNEDIYDRVKAMYEKYISPPECIILNVIPANVDFATSEVWAKPLFLSVLIA